MSAVEQMAARLDARRVRAGRWIARCPAHADRAPSLTVTEGRDGRVLLHCFAGCTLAAILQSAGLTMQQLFAASPSPSPALLARAAALRAQQQAQQAAARRRERVRSERCRLQLRDLYQSAGNLARTLALLPDKTPGAEALTACYHAMLTEQRLLERELDGDTGDSMSDHGNLSEFSARNNDNYPLRPTPEREAAVRAAVSAPHPLKNWPLPDPDKTKAALSVPESGWPEAMQDSAFQGLAGDFVRLVLPETEADPAALLLTFLVGVGSMIGRGPHYRVGASKHSVNLFGVVVGETSKARKGTATDLAVHILERADPHFMATRMSSGLSSGEGLIQAVRDPREEDVGIKPKDGQPMHFERQMVDTGEPDKRLLVVESEFGGVLQQTGREGNILSSVLRQAWDGKPLRILARSNKDNCQEPHIALIGNVTVEELKRLLTTNDRANGFGNRILWCCARRSKLLSRGGRLLDERVLEALAARVRNAVQAAQAMRLVNFDEEAFTAWDNLYPKLTEGASGLFGAMTGRGEAQVVRLSTLYALLDGSDLIRIEHLMAAQEVWGYCEESVRYIFGDVFGDETADAIMKALRNVPEGMTQTEINRSFGGHKAPAEMARALSFLRGKGQIEQEKLGKDVTGGRAAIRWRICPPSSGIPLSAAMPGVGFNPQNPHNPHY